MVPGRLRASGRTGGQRSAEPAFHSFQPMFQPPRPLSGATFLSLLLTTSTTSPTRRPVEEPAGRGVGAAALHVAQPDAAVADVGRAEGVRRPVVAVQEGAGRRSGGSRAGRPGCRTRRRSRRCAPFIRVTSSISVTTIFPLYVVVLGGARRDRHRGDAARRRGVPPWCARRRRPGRPGCGRPVKENVLSLQPVDAGRALDVAQPQVDGDLGAGLPVLLGAEVEPVLAEPVRADLDRRAPR